MSQEEKCMDKEMNGVCTKGKDCTICNKVRQEEQKLNINIRKIFLLIPNIFFSN